MALLSITLTVAHIRKFNLGGGLGQPISDIYGVIEARPYQGLSGSSLYNLNHGPFVWAPNLESVYTHYTIHQTGAYTSNLTEATRKRVRAQTNKGSILRIYDARFSWVAHRAYGMGYSGWVVALPEPPKELPRIIACRPCVLGKRQHYLGTLEVYRHKQDNCYRNLALGTRNLA